MTNKCPKCGSTKEPVPELETLPDGEKGAGVVWVCPDCGCEEM